MKYNNRRSMIDFSDPFEPRETYDVKSITSSIICFPQIMPQLYDNDTCNHGYVNHLLAISIFKVFRNKILSLFRFVYWF